MEIGKVIHKYRQEKGYTQEQLAKMLGISAPAVNKWENNNSYPDITLLAPLARALDITVDTLLSFRKELTEQEVQVMVQRLSKQMGAGEFEQAFSQANRWMEEYPGSELLALNLAAAFKGGILMYQVEETGEYRKCVRAWLELAVKSPDQRVREAAIPFLVADYESEEESEKAQELLDSVPEHSFNKNLMQATHYRKQGEIQKAYVCLEKYMQYLCNNLEGALQQLAACACKEGDYGAAKQYAAAYREMTKALERSPYNYYVLDFLVASEMKDKEMGLAALAEMIGGIEKPRNMREELFCRHLELSEGAGQFNEQMKCMLRKSFMEAEECAFLREDERFVELMERLK
ncbi:helix-turn-helix domain-containing protein [Roseburia hominis]